MLGNKFNLSIGFHGCDLKTRESLILNPKKVKTSEKPYDWLGHGFYVWEGNYSRALQWAKHKMLQGSLRNPAVVGVVYTLGNCLDFADTQYLGLLANYYKQMKKDYDLLSKDPPQNVNSQTDIHRDLLLRYLDCSVIEYIHEKIDEEISLQTKEFGMSVIEKFDTVRGIFTEGGPAFEGSGIQMKTHSQVCIRNLSNIIGFFIPRNLD